MLYPGSRSSINSSILVVFFQSSYCSEFKNSQIVLTLTTFFSQPLIHIFHQFYVFVIFICILTVKAKEIAFLNETLLGRDKQIAHLKEKVFQLQQNGQRRQFDFVKQMAKPGEELRKARMNIDEPVENFVKNKADVDGLQSELQRFNGECV